MTTDYRTCDLPDLAEVEEMKMEAAFQEMEEPLDMREFANNLLRGPEIERGRG